MAHSTSEYAQSHLVGEQLDDAEAVKEEMTQALLEAIDADYDNDGASAACDATSQQEGPSRRELVHSSIMAWDHSQPDDGNRLAVPHLFEARRRVGACGDFLQGGGQAEGVEAAALSGLSLAEALGGVLLFDSSHSKKDQLNFK